MQKKAFTLIELLVVIAIIAILAAILFPVFAQAKEAAKKTADLSNVKQLATATAIYLNDYDDMFPLQAGLDPATGVWGYNYNKYVPWDWPATGVPAQRVPFSQTFFMNSIYPYEKNYQLDVTPGASVVEYQPTNPVAVGKTKQTTNYAYNGFLTAYPSTSVASVATAPLITEQNGNQAGKGWGFANPALTCDVPNQGCSYIPWSSGCSNATNGATGAVYTTYNGGSYWIYSHGANWGMTDTHAKFRRMGATLSPGDTDYNVDPMTGYDATGHAGFYWYDGCHAWLFRPDYQP